MLFICNKLFPFKVHHDEIVHQSTFLSCRFNALMFKLHEVESKIYCIIYGITFLHCFFLNTFYFLLPVMVYQNF